MRSAFCLFLLSIDVVIGCQPEDKRPTDRLTVSTNQTLVITRTVGNCSEHCTQAFRIDARSVYPDLDLEFWMDCPQATYQTAPLAGIDPQQVDSLYTFLPADLLDATPEDFGCPGCTDQSMLPMLIYDEHSVLLHSFFCSTVNSIR